MSKEIVKLEYVPFMGHQILATLYQEKDLVVFRPIVERMGLAYGSQVNRLRRQPWATVFIMNTQLPDDIQSRETLLIDRRTLVMWLATIQSSRVAEHVKPILVAYQCEVADVLEAYFFGTTQALVTDLIQTSLNLAAVPRELKNTPGHRAQVKQHVKELSPRYPYLCPSHFLLTDFLQEKKAPVTPMVLLHFGKYVAAEFELVKGKKPKKGVRRSKKVNKAGFYAGGDWRVCERAWEKFQGHWSLTRALEA